MRGTVYAAKGEYDRAITDYDQAIHINPDDQYVFISRGDAYGAIRELRSCHCRLQLRDPDRSD